MDFQGKIVQVDVKNGELFCSQGLAHEVGPMGSLPGYGKTTGGYSARPVKASKGTSSFADLSAQLDALRRKSEAVDLELHGGSKSQPGGNQGAHDREYEQALAAKRQYKADQKRQEDADDAWVDAMLGLTRGTHPGTVRASMRVVAKNPAGDRLKKVAEGEMPAASSDDEDEKWVSEMLSLAGQKTEA